MAQLVSFCITSGQKPAVRYHRNQLPWCEQLATLVHRGLEAEEVAVRLFTDFLRYLLTNGTSRAIIWICGSMCACVVAFAAVGQPSYNSPYFGSLGGPGTSLYSRVHLPGERVSRYSHVNSSPSMFAAPCRPSGMHNSFIL